MSDDDAHDVARADQAEAAAVEVEDALRAVADEVGVPVFVLDEVDRIRVMVAAWRAGRGWLRGCPHVEEVSPSPVFGMVSKPARVWCRRCWPPVLRASSERSPSRCDSCGRRGEVSALVLAAEREVVLFAFVCPGCSVPPPEGW